MLNPYGPKVPFQTTSTDDKTIVLTDSLGRQLKFKTLDILYESRLTRMIGAEAASNPNYMMGYVLPAASVFEIDGTSVEPPTTPAELDAAISRLGREGLAAFLQQIQSEFQALQGNKEAALPN
ncbi:MAG: hypothetical protein V4731_07720 [Pseudomonadota bacterium]